MGYTPEIFYYLVFHMYITAQLQGGLTWNKMIFRYFFEKRLNFSQVANVRNVSFLSGEKFVKILQIFETYFTISNL